MAEEPGLGGRLEAEPGYGLKLSWSGGLLTLGGEVGEEAGVARGSTGAATLGLELGDLKPDGIEHNLMVTGELRF